MKTIIVKMGGLMVPGRGNPLPYENIKLLVGDAKITFDPIIEGTRASGMEWIGLKILFDTEEEIHLVSNDKIYEEKE